MYSFSELVDQKLIISIFFLSVFQKVKNMLNTKKAKTKSINKPKNKLKATI